MKEDILFEVRERLIKGNFMDEDEIVSDCKWKSLSSIIEDSLIKTSTENRE